VSTSGTEAASTDNSQLIVPAAVERLKNALQRNPALPVFGAVVADSAVFASPESESDDDLRRVRQLRSTYGPDVKLTCPLGLGDYLSLLFRLEMLNDLIADRGALEQLTAQRAWYVACCTALCEALGLLDSPLDTTTRDQPCDPRVMVNGLRPLLREKHGAFQAVYYEIALGGLLRQRSDILHTVRSVTYVEGGPGSGLADVALREQVARVYFTQFDEALLAFSRQLIDLDDLLLTMLPLDVGAPLEPAQLHKEFGYPDGQDARWQAAF
jgi:hypothetical protein